MDRRPDERSERRLSAEGPAHHVSTEVAQRPEQMNHPGSRYHQLRGNMVGRYAVRLAASNRVTFGWDEDRAMDVGMEDYL